MAIEQSRRTQLACKIVDLRKVKCPPHIRISRRESTAGAEDVDSRPQMAKIKSWDQRTQGENRIKQHLRIYHREATILASLSHVSKCHGHAFVIPHLHDGKPNVIGIEKVYITDNSMSVSNMAFVASC